MARSPAINSIPVGKRQRNPAESLIQFVIGGWDTCAGHVCFHWQDQISCWRCADAYLYLHMTAPSLNCCSSHTHDVHTDWDPARGCIFKVIICQMKWIFAFTVWKKRADHHIITPDTVYLLAMFSAINQIIKIQNAQLTVCKSECFLSFQDFSAGRETCLCGVSHDVGLQGRCRALEFGRGKRWHWLMTGCRSSHMRSLRWSGGAAQTTAFKWTIQCWRSMCTFRMNIYIEWIPTQDQRRQCWLYVLEVMNPSLTSCVFQEWFSMRNT